MRQRALRGDFLMARKNGSGAKAKPFVRYRTELLQNEECLLSLALVSSAIIESAAFAFADLRVPVASSQVDRLRTHCFPVPGHPAPV